MRARQAPSIVLDRAAMASRIKSLSWLLACVIVAGCGGAHSEPATAGGAQAEPEPTPSAAQPGSTPGGARPSITAQECETAGGSVVGDIGDGATLRADYLCANGKTPTGSIRAPEGGPIAIEGSVCCPK
jgi:hypothetical protein